MGREHLYMPLTTPCALRKQREWNRQCGLRSEVNEIITGKGKPDLRPMLYPVGASHQQSLVLEKKAYSSDPDVTRLF